jgi:cell division protein FtsL
VNKLLVAHEEYSYQDNEYEKERLRLLELQKNKIKKRKAKLKLRIKLISILCLASMGAIVLSQYVNICEQQNQIAKLQAKIKNCSADNEKLQVEITKGNNLDAIQQKAGKKYGMQVPDPSQIVYVSLKGILKNKK